MEHLPLVSIITIFLNADAFLEEAIHSVFAQTYSRWELLLVDDGSSDASTAKAQRWSRRYPERVRYLEHPGHANRGMSASRNRGLKEARGDYIALLDADDTWIPGKLAEQLAILNAHPRAVMVYGQSLLWWSWTGKPEDQVRDSTLSLGVAPDTLVEPPALLQLLLRNRTQTPTTCSVLLRRTVFDAVGGFQDDFRGMFEDQIFFAKLCLQFPVYVSSACWAKYRQHSQSCCAVATRQDNVRAARLRFLHWLDHYFVEQGVKDAALWQTLRNQLWPLEHPFLAVLAKRRRRFTSRIRRAAARIKSCVRPLQVPPDQSPS